MYSISSFLIGAITCIVSAHHTSALVPDECLSSIQHPPVTVTQSNGQYTQSYTTEYAQIGPSGLYTETYTFLETCSSPICRFPLETALPPSFTTGLVQCETCHNGGPLMTELTFPLESMQEYMATFPAAGSHDVTPILVSPTFAPTTLSPSVLAEATAHISRPSAAAGIAAAFFGLVALVI